MRFLSLTAATDDGATGSLTHARRRPVLIFLLLVVTGALLYSFGLQLPGAAIALVGVLHMIDCRARANLLELKARLDTLERQR
jgi:hypothetical protein